MEGTGPGIIAAYWTIAIYVIFGPLILLGIYTFFDWLAEKKSTNQPKKNNNTYKDKYPSLWTDNDIREYLKEK